MKQKEYLLSSLLVAFVAGFIYYAFADTDIIKKIPALAYQTILSVTDTRESITENKENSVVSTSIEIKDSEISNVMDEFSSQVYTSLPSHEAFNISIPDFSNYIKVLDFGGGIVQNQTERYLPERYHAGDFGFDSRFGNDMIVYAGNFDYLPLDSNEKKIRIKIHNLDSLNLSINEMVSKLTESIGKMTEQFRTEEFMKNFEHLEETDLEIHIDADELKAEIDESMIEFKEEMKKFNKDMKEFEFDMKEFQDSMKKMNEEMRDLKDSMRNIDSAKYNKRIKIKIDTIDT